MSGSATKRYRAGTHRACNPTETATRVRPVLDQIGVTRIADITGLDRIGIPVICCVRPRGEILQTTMGKGLRLVDAQVSGMMESLEHWHCERTPEHVVRCSGAALDPERTTVPVEALPLVDPEVTVGPARLMDWLPAEEVITQQPVWVPAAAACCNARPRAFTFSTNGLASGNTRVEASLHALYEILERDVVTRQIHAGGFKLVAPKAERVRAESVAAEPVAELLGRIELAGLGIALIIVRNGMNLPVFWAALLDPDPFHPCTRVNFGYGAHLSPTVAAVRAISEAAQSRLSYIHGVREDLGERIRSAKPELVQPVFDYFSSLPCTLDWSTIDDQSADDLTEDWSLLLQRVEEAGYTRVYRTDLTRPDIGIPVVRLLVPGAQADRRFF